MAKNKRKKVRATKDAANPPEVRQADKPDDQCNTESKGLDDGQAPPATAPPATVTPGTDGLNFGFAKYFYSLAKQNDITDADIRSGHLHEALRHIKISLEQGEHVFEAHKLAMTIHEESGDVEKWIQHIQLAIKHWDGVNASELVALVANHRILINQQAESELLKKMGFLKPYVMCGRVDIQEIYRNQPVSVNFDIIGDEDLMKGHTYYLGMDGHLPNHEMASKYYAKAALEKNNPEGLYCYALMLMDGTARDVRVNSSLEVVPYLLKAAISTKIPENGHSIGAVAAQHYIAFLLYNEVVNSGGEPRPAFVWCRKAAENGCGHAMNNLGVLYFKGVGVPEDQKMAEDCWKKAMSMGHKAAAYSLLMLYIENLALDEAKEVLQKACRLGHVRIEENKEAFLLEIERRRDMVQDLPNWTYGMNSLPTFENLVESEKVIATEPWWNERPLVTMGSLELIRRHRMLVKELREEKANKRKEFSSYKVEDGTKNEAHSGEVMKTKEYEKFISRMQTISLEEMDPRKKLRYDGQILFLIICEDPVCTLRSPDVAIVSVIAKDPNGNVTRLIVHKRPEEDHEPVLEFGTRLGIINPELWFWPEVYFGVFVKDPHISILHLASALRKCRYCAFEDANNLCSICKKVWYCSRECQTIDWIEYEHKLICVP